MTGIACDVLVHPSPLAIPTPTRNTMPLKRTTLAFALNGSYMVPYLH
jgi:hypothetical protein